MFDHLLESSHRDDSNKWSNIGFGQEIKELASIEIHFTHLIWCSVHQSKFHVIAITYQWMKSDADMFAPGIGPTSTEFVRPDLNNHLFISGNGKLYFSEVTTNVDKGFYYCVATLSAINKNHNYIGASQPPIRTSKGIELSPRTSCKS